MNRRRLSMLLVTAALGPLAPVSAGQAQTLAGPAFVVALRQGGYVLAMRHASSPRQAPDAASAEPDNTGRERQLDVTGRDSAQAMGEAFRRLRIPFGEVLSSPTYRALQTVRLAALPGAKTADELGDGGQGMAADTEGKRSAWLRAKAAEPTRAGTNTLLVTHAPNLTGAFAQEAAGMADGEAMVFRPDGRGAAQLVGRVKIEDWARLG